MLKRIICTFLLLLSVFACSCEKSESRYWVPDQSEIWNYCPVVPVDTGEMITYDLELTLENNRVSVNDLSHNLVLKIQNNSGQTFRDLTVIYLEKAYNIDYQYVASDIDKVWLRVPFVTSYTIYWSETVRADVTYIINLEESLVQEYKYTSGKYRLVYYAADGPYYVYFEIVDATN